MSLLSASSVLGGKSILRVNRFEGMDTQRANHNLDLDLDFVVVVVDVQASVNSSPVTAEEEEEEEDARSSKTFSREMSPVRMSHEFE